MLAAILVSVVVSQASDYSGLEAAKHIGEQAAVTDRVDDVHEAKGNIFVNMGGRHPNEVFTAFIPSKSAKDFPDIKECKGVMLTISGKIQEHNGKPENCRYVAIADQSERQRSEQNFSDDRGVHAGRTEVARDRASHSGSNETTHSDIGHNT